jgi:hypothetical protein
VGVPGICAVPRARVAAAVSRHARRCTGLRRCVRACVRVCVRACVRACLVHYGPARKNAGGGGRHGVDPTCRAHGAGQRALGIWCAWACGVGGRRHARGAPSHSPCAAALAAVAGGPAPLMRVSFAGACCGSIAAWGWVRWWRSAAVYVYLCGCKYTCAYVHAHVYAYVCMPYMYALYVCLLCIDTCIQHRVGGALLPHMYMVYVYVHVYVHVNVHVSICG